MSHQDVVVLGGEIAHHRGLASVIGQFQWTPQTANSLAALAQVSAGRRVAAVLVHPPAIDLPWKQALAAVHEVVPDAALILCHGFSDDIDWSEASSQGAFHLLRLPLNLGELRQILGFVWAARNKRFHVIPSETRVRSHLRQTPPFASQVA